MRSRLVVFLVIGFAAVVVACLPSCVADTANVDVCDPQTLCEEVNAEYKRDIETIVASINSCEVREDCTSAVPTLGCPDQATWLTTCPQGIRADAVNSFDAEVAALSDRYCGECELECHHDDELSCTAPIAKCLEGRCVVEFAEDVE